MQIIGIYRAGERRISQHHIVFFGFFLRHLFREGVATNERWILDAVQNHVHPADAHHRAVDIVAGETLAGQRFFDFQVPAPYPMGSAIPLEKHGLRVGSPFQNVLDAAEEESAGPGGGVHHPLPGLGVDQFHHEADDMTRGAELPLFAGGLNLAEQVFKDIAHDVVAL